MTFPAMTPYTFGCMSLGADLERISDDVAVARRAMDAGVWFHCSPTYNRGFCFMILRMAFDACRTKTPPLIVKVRDGSPELMRFEEDACRRLGVDGLDVAQLVSMDRNPDNLLSQLATGGPLADELADLRTRGVIRHAVVYVDEGNADEAVERAEESGLIDGLTGYWNPWQRCLTPKAWRGIREHGVPFLAIRTLAGAEEGRRDSMVDAAGCADEVELSLRLAASFDCVRTSIGGTRNAAHLERFLEAATSAEPLPPEILEKLHDRLFEDPCPDA